MVNFLEDDIVHSIPLQWHITVKCDQDCKHCYMKDEKFYEKQLKNPLSYEECIRIIDNYINFSDHWKLNKYIYFTGGDPLLRKDFFDILKYCKKNEISTGVLGNPFHIDERTALKLEKFGLLSYQLSIDGMEKLHDELRSKGSFKETLRALEILNKTNIKTKIMFTISKKNKNDLFDVIDLVVKKNVGSFSFTRLIPQGSGKSFKKYLFTSKEYRKLLFKVLEKYRKYYGCETTLGRKDCDPWALLEKDLGLLTPGDLERGDQLFLSRCPLGNHLCILADGTVLACRKLPIEIGQLPEQSFEEIMSSKKLKEIINKRCIETKKGCFRGCAAMSYATTGDVRKTDPQIWC